MQSSFPSFPYFLYQKYTVQPETLSAYLNNFVGGSIANATHERNSLLISQINKGPLASTTNIQTESAQEAHSTKFIQPALLNRPLVDKEEVPKAGLSETNKSTERLSKEVGILTASKKISQFANCTSNTDNYLKKIRRSWSKEEDQIILQLIQEYGQNWGAISRKIGGARSGKQIRDRYLNKLDPNINSCKWTEEEDKTLLKLYLIEGRKWCQISKSIAGRTEAGVKNRFYAKYKHLLSKDSPELLKNLKSEEIKKLVCSKDEISSKDEIGSKEENSLQCESRLNNSRIFFNNRSNNQTKDDYPTVNNLSQVVRLNSMQRNQIEDPVSAIKIEHGQLKIEEDATISPHTKPPSQKMELENHHPGDETDELLDKIEEQIISLEKVLQSSYFSLNVTQSIKKILDNKRSVIVSIRNQPIPQIDFDKMVANLALLKNFFKNTTQDIDRMLMTLIQKLRE